MLSFDQHSSCMDALPDLLDDARALLADADQKLAQLRAIEPYLIDISLRENPVGSGIGHTLEDKLRILPQLRDFGMRNIHLGSLDYPMPDEHEVDDDFMAWLRDHEIDMNGCFAFTDTGAFKADGSFQPSPSMLKLQAYTVPNTLHEIYLSDAGMAGLYDFDTLCRNLRASIAWLHANITGDHGGAPRILINIVDGCDALTNNLERSCALLALLAGENIEGVSIEDDRGTYLPFQVGACVAIARRCLPAPKKIVVHVHAGAGYENASVIEALLRGADGVWGGIPKQAAIIGHASLGELIANLVRIGNPYMDAYRVERLLPLATSLQERDSGQAVPDDLPVLGRNAYRLTLDFFRQTAARPMDLPPERIGGRYGYRVCPVVSDRPVIAGRLAEVTGHPADSFTDEELDWMIRLMRRDLRAGLRLAYDKPAELLALHSRALAMPTAPLTSETQ
jgi:isopropylmalate/homocitrate/citramalate synthase